MGSFQNKYSDGSKIFTRAVPDITNSFYLKKDKNKKYVAGQLNHFLKCIVWNGTKSTESVGIIQKTPSDSPNVTPS